jgi:hypothetical protein
MNTIRLRDALAAAVLTAVLLAGEFIALLYRPTWAWLVAYSTTGLVYVWAFYGSRSVWLAALGYLAIAGLAFFFAWPMLTLAATGPSDDLYAAAAYALLYFAFFAAVLCGARYFVARIRGQGR